jgi:predicted kinase
MKIIVMRGLPGSGKSTWIWKNYPTGTVICSADDFWIQDDGSYRFDPELLGIAHKQCKDKFAQSVLEKKLLVIVDNTNTSMKEMKFYLDEAEKAGFILKLVYCKCSIDTACARNVHSVPRTVIERMYSRLETPIPEKYSSRQEIMILEDTNLEDAELEDK